MPNTIQDLAKWLKQGEQFGVSAKELIDHLVNGADLLATTNEDQPISLADYPSYERLNDWIAMMEPGRQFTVDTIAEVFGLEPVTGVGRARVLGNLIRRHAFCNAVKTSAGYHATCNGRAVFVRLPRAKGTLQAAGD